MTDVSIIGLGVMGAAIARVLHGAGFEIAVWNRSMEKAKPFAEIGAVVASDPCFAIKASLYTIICIDGYETALEVLDNDCVQDALPGRTIIQLSTGTPQEAADLCTWVISHGGNYLDGAIMVYPQKLGAKDAQVLISGPEDVYSGSRHILSVLGGELRYLGENVRAVATLDLALLSRLTAHNIGTIYGAHICEAEGISVELFSSLLPESDHGYTLAKAIALDENTVARIGSSVNILLATLGLLQRQASDAGIKGEIPNFFYDLVERAVAAGYGKEGTTALIKLLRK